MSARQPPATPTPADHDSRGWLLLFVPWVLILVLLAGLLLSGCERASVKVAEQVQTIGTPTIYRDAETGCEYVGLAGGVDGGLYPRMGRDGKQICREKK